MSIIRLILLVMVLGGLTLFLVQNWSPVLPVFFVGTQTKALPLGLWILFSTAAGAFSSLVITGLFKLSTSVQQKAQTSPPRTRFTTPRNQQIPREEQTPPPPSPPPPKNDTDFADDSLEDDWDSYRSTDDDWDFEEQPESPTTTQTKQTQVQDSPNYQNQQKSKSSHQSGSSYSYSRTKPENSGVGKAESIYDADYRVIIPPYQPPANPQVEESDDDWGIFDDEDDDFDNGDPQSRR